MKDGIINKILSVCGFFELKVYDTLKTVVVICPCVKGMAHHIIQKITHEFMSASPGRICKSHFCFQRCLMPAGAF